MIHRITVKSWYNHDQITLYNGLLKKESIRYTPQYDFQDSLLVRKLSEAKGCDRGMPDLAKVLLVAGSYATAWVGDLEGVIVPMDVQPEGWTYASGEPVEPSWFWQWVPSERARKVLQGELSDDNPFTASPAHFKRLSPYATARSYGAVTEIQGVDIFALVGMIKQDVPWVFEFESECT